MSRYVMVNADGPIDAKFSPSDDHITVKFGEATVDITVDEATALRASLEQALIVSTLPKCPDCNGRGVLRVDGQYRTCGTCRCTGLAPIADGGGE